MKRDTQQIQQQQQHQEEGVVVDSKEMYPGGFMGYHNRDLVVVPSMSLSPYELVQYTPVSYLEERSLFYLLLLRDPTIRMFFVTSRPVDESIVTSFLSLSGVGDLKDARSRLHMISLNDCSFKRLATKLLDHQDVLHDIKSKLRPERGGLICVQSEDDEYTIATELGIQYLGNDPVNEKWGTKFGSRSLFAEAGVPHASGIPLVYTVEDLAQGIVGMWEEDPSIVKIMVKLDQSFNGEGNAILDLAPLGKNINTETVLEQLSKVQLSSASQETWDSYSKHLLQCGAVAERYLENEKSTPSFIGFISGDGTVNRLGTQQQVLEDLEYMGCIFPADESYRVKVQEYGYRVGKALAAKGARGHFGVDFMVCEAPKTSEVKIFAVEINLRHTGSTYPFMLTKLLTEATLEPKTGLLKSSLGKYKYYKSSNCVKKEHYKQLTPARMLELLGKEKLLFDSSTQTGVAFQQLGAISEFGKFGMTCIADSHKDAEETTNRVLKVLDDVLLVNSAAPATM